MALRVLSHPTFPLISFSNSSFFNSNLPKSLCFQTKTIILFKRRTRKCVHTKLNLTVISAALPPLDLTEDNIRLVLEDARSEFPQIFDTSVGMTGKVDLAELDGPFVKISLKGRFWHKRSTVLARISNYLKIRIPEILEVDIEDEKQLDDSPANF